MMSKLGQNILIEFLTNFFVSPKESEEVRKKQKDTKTHHRAHSRQIRHHIDRSHHTSRSLADTDCWHTCNHSLFDTLKQLHLAV